MNPEIHEAIPDTTAKPMDTDVTTEPEEEILYSSINTRIIDLEKGWRDIAWGIVKFLRILEGFPEPPFDADDHMLIYDTVYNMCYQRPPHDHSEQLYDRYHDSIEVYCSEVVLPSLVDKEGELMLLELVRRWDNHKVLIKWLSVFFGMLNRYYVGKADVPRIEDVGLFVFRDGLFRNVGCYARAVVMSLIEAEREGGKIDRGLLRTVVDVFVAMGNGKICIYENDFEKLMIRETGEYYSRKAANWVVEDSLVEYLFRTEECLRREKERVSHYLHSSSEGKLLEKVHHELVVVYAQQLLDKEYGFSALLRDNKLEDLSMVYRFYSRTAKELELIVSAFKKQLLDEGKALVQQAEDGASSQGSSNAAVGEHGVELMRKIIEMNEKYKGCVEGCFMKNSLFQKALREAFEVFCNMPVGGNSSAELLAEFCNSILKKKGGYQLSDEEIDETFENVVKVFAYFNDKDLFAEYCRKKLARRLLFDQGSCDDHEKSLLAKLKQHCGGQFTAKMEGMITDLTLSKDTQINFENFLNCNPHVKPGIDLTVTVLTTGNWPTYKSADLNLPEEMVKCVEVFKGFFETEKKHRKLQWIYSLGTCNVIGKFERKTMELVVSTSQAALLLLFNYADRLSFSEILTQSNLTDEDLVRLLHSLSCAKYKILIKEPNTKTISPNDVFMFNSKFTNKMRRIKIPLPPVDDRKKFIEDVDKDRRHAIDAAVVRIMKSRKVMSHQDLVMESVEQLQSMFKPDIRSIKKRIEDLITREYLERDEEDPTKFKYLA